jgi:pimeloyl-ACP methyl ester carboxylesterase
MEEKKRWLVGASEPFEVVNICGVSIAYCDSGLETSEPVVITLHAIGHGSKDFEKFTQKFCKQFRIISIDWPGQGRSGQDDVPASVHRYATLLTEFIVKLDLKNIILFGNSIGGAVALRYCAKNPKQVLGAIICNCGGTDKGGILGNIYIRYMESKFKKGADQSTSFGKWFKEYYQKVLQNEEAKEQRQRIIDSGYEIAHILEQAWFSFRQPENDVRKELKDIQVPVFIGWGANDPVIQWSRNKDALNTIPNKTIEFFETGHSPFLEDSEAFNKKVATFLESLQKKPSEIVNSS